MDSIISIIGIFGGICIGISFIPQVIRTVKDGHADGISPWFVAITFVSSLSMLIYGGYFMVPPILLANGSVACNNIIIAAYKMRKKCQLNKINMIDA